MKVFDERMSAEQCRYHGGYVCEHCPNTTRTVDAVSRPKPGCKPGCCRTCGHERTYVDLMQRAADALHASEHRDPFDNTYRLTEAEVMAELTGNERWLAGGVTA